MASDCGVGQADCQARSPRKCRGSTPELLPQSTHRARRGRIPRNQFLKPRPHLSLWQKESSHRLEPKWYRCGEGGRRGTWAVPGLSGGRPQICWHLWCCVEGKGGWTLICWHQGVTLHVSDLLYGGQRPAHRVALAAGKEHCTNLGNQGRSCLPFALLGPAIPGVPLTKAARLE